MKFTIAKEYHAVVLPRCSSILLSEAQSQVFFFGFIGNFIKMAQFIEFGMVGLNVNLCDG